MFPFKKRDYWVGSGTKTSGASSDKSILSLFYNMKVNYSYFRALLYLPKHMIQGEHLELSRHSMPNVTKGSPWTWNCAICELAPQILIRIPWGTYYYFMHFTIEETEAESCPKCSLKPEFELGQSGSRVHTPLTQAAELSFQITQYWY